MQYIWALTLVSELLCCQLCVGNRKSEWVQSTVDTEQDWSRLINTDSACVEISTLSRMSWSLKSQDNWFHIIKPSRASCVISSRSYIIGVIFSGSSRTTEDIQQLFPQDEEDLSDIHVSFLKANQNLWRLKCEEKKIPKTPTQGVTWNWAGSMKVRS